MTTAIRKGTVNLLITKFLATQVNYCTLYSIYFLDRRSIFFLYIMVTESLNLYV